MTFIEQLIEVMSDHRGPAHVDDIADMLAERFPASIKSTNLSSRVSNALAADVKKTGRKANFAKVKNKNDGFKRGIYRLKHKQIVQPQPTPPPQVTSQYIGKAGEAAVISEMLFYGFNASAMAVDDGIDVIASKDNKFFHIQVKTANISGDAYSFSIKRTSFNSKNSSQTFYIFVIRQSGKVRLYNDYLILPSNQLKQFIDAGVIRDSANFSVRIQKNSKDQYVLNGKQDVTISINAFGQIN